MGRTQSNKSSDVARVEHAIATLTSLTWTGIVLLALVFLWGLHDAQAQWDIIEHSTESEALAELKPSGGTQLRPRSDDPSAPIGPGIAPGGPSQALPETPSEGISTATATAAPTPTPRPSDTPTLPRPSPAFVTPQRTRPLAKTGDYRSPFISIPTPTSTPPPTSAPSPSATPRGPDRLVIASLGIDAPVLPVKWIAVREGGQTYHMWEVADYAAGWHVTSSAPGQPGNTVISGHHNIKGEVFRYLADVQEGADVDLYVGDQVYRYTVEQKLIVKEKGEPLAVRQRNAKWIGPTEDTRLTLVTCWPYTNNTHRVIVVAKPRS